MEKVKVLHLELDSQLGGIESFLYNLYCQIDREQVQFDFITRSDSPAKGFELEQLGAKIFKISSYSNPRAYMRELEKVINNGYDVIHIHKNSAAIILPFLVIRRHKNLKVFVHSHNTRPSIGGITKILHLLNRKILWKYSNRHFACSEVAGKWLYGANKDFTVLKNGIITERYRFDSKLRAKTRLKLGISEDYFVIGNIGRFTEQKNQMRLVRIFKQLLIKKSNCVLLLVGDGVQRKKVENYCKEKLLTAHVIFLGIRNDISELLMAMDAFVMPSLYEGLPIAAIEAQAAGLPLFLSDTISPETGITDGVNWFSLNDSDTKIADDILVSTRTGDLDRNKLGNQVVDKGYDMKDTAMKMLNYYLS